jgi:hypothetical protein
MNKLKYASSEQMYEGILVEVTEGSVTIDIKGRLGQIKLPLRMIITDYPLKVGQIVGFLMSYPELLDPAVDEEYLKTIKETNSRKAKIKGKEY